MIAENDFYPGGVSGHATNSICLRALPWADAILDSEYPMQDPITAYTPDHMIASSCPHNFGVNISHLGFMNPDGPRCTTPAWAGRRIFATPEFRHFGIARDDVEFVGHWRNGKLVEQIGEGLLASIWKRPGAAIVEVLNYGLDPEDRQKTRQGDLTLNLAALGIPAGTRRGISA